MSLRLESSTPTTLFIDEWDLEVATSVEMSEDGVSEESTYIKFISTDGTMYYFNLQDVADRQETQIMASELGELINKWKLMLSK